MSIPLLKTKLYVPPLRPKMVSRPRLLERLKASPQVKLALVAAPAGYGKTTLLIEGIHNYRMPVGWLSLDKDDNDPVRFWSYIISALQTVHADMGKSILELLQSQQAPPIDYALTMIINEMNDVDEDFALVLDDYHVIEAQPIHDSMTFLLNHLPPQVHLVIASRTDPPVSLARLRVQNQLMEIRADDLRFSPDETIAFFNDVMKLGLSDQDVATIESRTEGWIASLQLAAVSMQGRENISAYISEFGASSRYVMDYLIEEVLEGQDEADQSFLLKTSILNRFTAALCDAVTGSTDSRERLARFDATNLFLVPLDNERQWYRYHHLFAELLQNQLIQSQEKHITELHLKSSEWFEKEGLISEAIYHAFANKDYKRAANLMDPVAFTMVMQSQYPTVLDWLDKLPSVVIADHPWLCVSGAFANQLTGQLDAVEPLIQYAESAMSRIEEKQPAESFPKHARIRNLVMIVRITNFLLMGEFQRVIELCHQALVDLPADDMITRAAVVGDLGISYWMSGDLVNAMRYMEETDTFGRAAGSFHHPLYALSYQGDIHRVQGHLHQAAEKYREAIQLGSQQVEADPLPATGNAYVGLSQVLYEWNDVNSAIYHASLGTKLAERGGIIRTIMIGSSLLAWQNQALRNNNATKEALQRAEVITTQSSHFNLIYLFQASAWKARISLAQGDLNAANRWVASQEPKLNLQDIPDFWSEQPYLTFMRLHIAQGKVDEIPGLLDNLAQKVEAEERTGSLIEILALQSIAFQAQGDSDQALAALERALSLAEPEGYVRTFIDEGEPMAKLLRLAESRGIARKYARKLLASFHMPTAGAGPQSERLINEGNDTPPSLIEPLTERELKVMQLIVEGKSNREIAEILFIVEGTVKTHINNIYTKLDVQSRTQAIARVRELKLL